MSASPLGNTPGRTPGRTPNGGGPPQMIRRPKNADPLVRPKKRRPQGPPGPNGAPSKQQSGPRPPPHGQRQPTAPGRPPLQSSLPSLPSLPLPSLENATSGFSSAPLGQPVRDYPLVLTKRALMEGFRHHVARFSSKKSVDPRNTEEFVRPVRLHRRDPRAPPAGAGGKAEEQNGGMDGLDDKDKEKEAIAKAEKEAIRDAESALVAPATGTSHHKKLDVNTKKTEQIYRNDQTEEQKARSKLKYEEALPWHLEDFDNKSTWVGTYEAALSDTYAMMVQGPDQKFRVVPLEKWYKFTQKNQFKTLSIEEAEMRFNKKVKEPRWFMDSEEAKKKRQLEQENRKASRGLFVAKWERGDGGNNGVTAPAIKNENADADDLDYMEDRFADDEENVAVEEDEETKEAEERIKKDQLQANVFDLKSEKEYEKQEELERKEKEAEKKLGKSIKKKLRKREKNYVYDDDSDDNPYSEKSESSSSETERLKAEEEKKKATEPPKSSPDKPKKSKQTSNSGASTPSHRSSKHEPLSRTASSSSLKRPGSPLNSEGSGNESSRKKPKKKHPLTTSSQPPTSTLNPPSSAPAPPSNKRRATAGSGSDSEGPAMSAGEMSDGTRTAKRIKLKLSMGSKSSSPTNSRAVSPEAGAASPPGPRSVSPDSTTKPEAANGKGSAEELPFPTPAELKAKVPKSGITIPALLALFRGQVVGDVKKKMFSQLMRENSKYDKERKLLFPIPTDEERARERVERERGGREGRG